jgi:hypothetical protein
MMQAMVARNTRRLEILEEIGYAQIVAGVRGVSRVNVPPTPATTDRYDRQDRSRRHRQATGKPKARLRRAR